MIKWRRFGSGLLAAALVMAQMPTMDAKAAQTQELTYEYETTGNTGAVITVTSGQAVTATVSDESIATVEVDGSNIVVSGQEDAVGIATVSIGYENGKTCEVEVPVGYTTFLFEEDAMTVYEGEDTKYEVSLRSYTAQTEEEGVTGTTLEDGSIMYSNTEDGSVCVNIKKKGGTYVFTGEADDMSISVNKEATGEANLLMAGLDMSSSFTSPVTVKKDSEDTASVTITALAGHVNTLTDSAVNNADVYGDTSDGGDGTNTEFAESAVIKAKSSAKVIINGSGTLKLDCATKNAIKVGEYGSLVIDGANLEVTSAGHGISSDNTLEIQSGELVIDATEDAIRSNPDAVDATAGCAGTIEITGGSLELTAGSDGIQAAQDLTISGGDFNIQTGNGYNDSSFNADTMSCKGLKTSVNTDDTTTDTATATNTITITGGTFELNTADDAIHSDAYAVIEGGEFVIRTGDDGVHADTSLTLGIEDGAEDDVSITVTNAYEALEGGCVYVYSGTYDVAASDDGINAAGDSGTSGDSFNPGGAPGGFGNQGTANSSGHDINIAGGRVKVNANGDGLDANSNLNLTGGKIVVWGAAAGSDNEPLDCDGTVTINGATVFAAGSGSMMTSPGNSSQSYITYGGSASGNMGGNNGGMPGGMGGNNSGSTGSTNGSGTISAGQTINVKNNSTTVYNAEAVKNVNYVLYSSPEVTASGWTIDADDSALLDEACANGHSYGEGIVVTEATCAKEGIISYTCSVCGDTTTTGIDKLEHSFTNYVSDNNATTEADGTKTAKCDNCDATDTIADEGSQLPESGEGSTDDSGNEGSTEDSGNEGSTEDSGNEGSTEDSGNEGSTEDSGSEGSTEDGGNEGSTEDSGNEGSTEDSGNEGSTEDSGNEGSTEDSGNEGSTEDSGSEGSTEDGGNEGSTEDSGSEGSTEDSGSDERPGRPGSSGNEGSTEDSGNEGSTEDSGSEGSTEDGGSEGSTEDSGNEGSTEDSGSEGSTEDGGSEGSTEDSGSEGSTEGSGSEGSTEDSGNEGSTEGSGSTGSDTNTGTDNTTGSNTNTGTSDTTGSNTSTGTGNTTNSNTNTETNNSTNTSTNTNTNTNTSTNANTVVVGSVFVDASGLAYKVTSVEAGKQTVICQGFAAGKKAAKVTIPATVTNAGVTYKVTAVAASAFKRQAGIKTVTIGKHVTTIGANAFNGCKKLQKVTIGKNVTVIGKSAFASCKKLKTITVKSTSLKSVGKKAISGISKKAVIKVPKKKFASYKKLLGKKSGYKSSMKIKK